MSVPHSDLPDLPLTYSTVSPKDVAINVDANHDTEASIEKSFEDSNTRLKFTQKVISIILLQLLAVFIVYVIFAYNRVTMKRDTVFIALGVTFVLITAMAFSKIVRQMPPLNFIFLGIFTISESFSLGAAATTCPAEQVMLAAGITIAISLVLILFAFQTEYDFTIMGGFLFCAKVVLFILGTPFIFYYNNCALFVYGCIGAPIFCIYLICDTQLTLEGKHKYSISLEEYIFAAINVYLDIMNIFIYIIIFL